PHDAALGWHTDRREAAASWRIAMRTRQQDWHKARREAPLFQREAPFSLRVGMGDALDMFKRPSKVKSHFNLKNELQIPNQIHEGMKNT
ncbi:hypothetical protein HAX54_001410, partial [Datura stramonium]|nr:hypothetical protein [Datura stramonium]